ncbi:NACHT domain-containing protein [Mycena sanguinolenta]|uniref:NACHT domain-containing protein n=1 Tax=Mycena sanguinolenta TaxID=230812 RepID=A0A8H6Z9I9_9AGAR|nr:NACHT domain-containing protein [Mycena sanguinolenta]
MFPGIRMMINYINGGRGGAGGQGHRSGIGGAGGHGMGPSLNFDIRPGGNFTMNNVQQAERGIDILHRAVAPEAIHDSTDSFPQPKCHPETRTKMLKHLRNWAVDPNPETTVLWLHGPAGAGKSAILQTLASQLQDAGALGGCFFFKRNHPTRGNAKKLVTTIAYQLALAVPWLRASISQIVENDPSTIFRSIGTQMKVFISDAFRAHVNRRSVTILIDGLDECEGHNIQQEILRAIRDSFFNHPIPVLFLVASRPEPHIREMFDSPLYAGHYVGFNVEKSFNDVYKYLWDEFSRIHHEHSTMAKIPRPWPSFDVLEDLVDKSSGHFIYAVTIIKFIDDKNYRPTQRLAMVLENSSQGSPFGALDQLYMDILESTPRRSELIPILCAIANIGLTVHEIDWLFELVEGETRLLLRGLHSVLQVPLWDNGYISTHHASFLDFLNDHSRSHNFYIGSLDHQMDLARSFLRRCARRIQPSDWYRLRHPQEHLIPFITSLPPSIELCPLIACMEPARIFALTNANFKDMLSWLKRIPSVPQDLIELWEDCTYVTLMATVDTSLMVKHINSPSSELCQVLVALRLEYGLHSISHLLDITWDKLRTIICSLRPSITETGYWATSYQILQAIIPWEDQRWTCQDIALKCICRIVNPSEDCSGMGIEFDEWKYLTDMLTHCPPCDTLYREFQRIPRSMITSYFEDGSSWHHDVIAKPIFQWLESFGDPTLELAAFWRQEILPLTTRL